MADELRLLLSDEDTRKAKSEIRDFIIEIFDKCQSLDEKRDMFWHKIVEPGWSPPVISWLMAREGHSEALLAFEAQMFSDVMSELGYDITDGFC